jgi:type IV pilus assembly protein PilM
LAESFRLKSGRAAADVEAMRRSSRSTSAAVGLDLDGAFLAAVETAGGELRRAVSTDLAPGLIAEGEVRDADGLGEALKAFFKAHGLPPAVRLGVSNHQIVVRQIELPRVDDPEERSAAIRFLASDAIAMPLEEAILDHQVIGERTDYDGTVRTQAVVVAARTSMIERLVDAVRGAGLKPLGIDLNAFALVRSLADHTHGTGLARVHCHLGGITNLAVAIGPSCVFTRPLSTSLLGADGTDTAALAEEIRLSVDFYMTQPHATAVEDVLLSGPGAAADGLAARLATLVGVPVSVAESPPALRTLELPSDEDPHRHMVAVGLALGGQA